MAQRVSRKQLKQDEFVEAAADAGHWIEEHWADLLKWIAVAVVIVVAILSWMAYSRSKQETTAKMLSTGLWGYQQLQKGGFADTTQLNELLGTFDEVSDRAGSSSSGQIAEFYRGAVLFRLGRTDEAISALEAVAASPSIGGSLSSTTDAMLARVYVDSGQRDKAIKTLDNSLQSERPDLPKDQILLTLAQIHEDGGDMDRARRAWQQIVDDFPTSPGAGQARRRLAE